MNEMSEQEIKQLIDSQADRNRHTSHAKALATRHNADLPQWCAVRRVRRVRRRQLGNVVITAAIIPLFIAAFYQEERNTPVYATAFLATHHRAIGAVNTVETILELV